jgi:hypothetical protein
MMRNHAFGLPLTVLVASLPLAGCSQSGELSRGEAAEAIVKQLNEVSPETKPLAMNESQFGAGVSQGYWNIDGILTPKGQEHFSSVGINGSDIRLFLRRPHEFEIEVTGIRQDNANATTTTAEFTVSNENLTGVARRFALTGGVGQATFQRFDDGWRLQDVSSVSYPVATNGVGGELVLSASEKQVAEREAAAQQAQVAQEEARERADFQAATVPSASRTFTCQVGQGQRRVTWRVTVTNVNITIVRSLEIEQTNSFEYRFVYGIKAAQGYSNQREIRIRYENPGGTWLEHDFYNGCSDSQISEVVTFTEGQIARWKSQWGRYNKTR